MNIWLVLAIVFFGNAVAIYYEAYRLQTPRAACVLSMERKAINDPAYFKEFWERVAVKYEEENK